MKVSIALDRDLQSNRGCLLRLAAVGTVSLVCVLWARRGPASGSGTGRRTQPIVATHGATERRDVKSYAFHERPQDRFSSLLCSNDDLAFEHLAPDDAHAALPDLAWPTTRRCRCNSTEGPDDCSRARKKMPKRKPPGLQQRAQHPFGPASTLSFNTAL